MTREILAIDWVESEPALEAWVERLAQHQVLAIDTEANGFHAYRPRLCLIQCAVVEGAAIRVALIDAVRLQAQLGRLEPILGNPDYQKVMHGSDYDIRLLHRDAGLTISGLFDTQIAARLAGHARCGLASLCQELLAIELDKSQQRIDWGQRPLAEKARQYAADDVAVLPRLRLELLRALAQHGRDVWAEECFRRQERERGLAGEIPSPQELLQRHAPRELRDPRARAIAAELLTWRELEAQRRDRPAIKIAEPRWMVALADAVVRAPGEPSGVVPNSFWQRHRLALAAAIERGQAAPELPCEPRLRRVPIAPEVRDALAVWKRHRDRRASKLALDPGLLAPNACLERLAVRPVVGLDQLTEAGLMSWQARELWEAAQEPSGETAEQTVSCEPVSPEPSSAGE
jgi:ribonuclease D